MTDVKRVFKIHKNEKGFTLIELLVVSTVSVLLIALVSGIFQSQSDTFVLQNQLNKMQTNGRASVDYFSRLVQNSGYNVVRGTRFLAASDHYLTSVFDKDNDGIIQNSDIITFAMSNVPGAVDETINISPYWDVDGNGVVESDESRPYAITLTHTAPPYVLYQILPSSVDDNSFTRNRVAQDIDNLVIRYYDKNDAPLPSGVAVDGNGLPIPPYALALTDMNNIRRVEVEVVARTRNPDPRGAASATTGTYTAGSIATLGGVGSATYNDAFHRQTFQANISPRNLVMAPWGKMDITAVPNPIPCPDDTTTVTASLVDSEGEAAPANITINFTSSDGILAASNDTTDAFGDAQVNLSYDWALPSTTITFSASALIDVGGQDNPVFSSIPISFVSGSGIFTDNFDDGDSDGWDEVGVTNWNVAAGQYQTASNGNGISVNGCDAWQNYELQIDTQRNGSLGTGEYTGMILRYQDATQYYMARIFCELCTGPPAGHIYKLQLVNFNSGETVLVTSAPITFDNNTLYTLKASVDADNLNMKIWEKGTAEPGAWTITTTDASYTQGQIGLVTDQNVSVFDSVAVNPL
jgi:prepilin-type N-terminal cleavage/methylation domain-containing protein